MEQQREIKLESSWKNRLQDEFTQPYMAGLRQFLLERKRDGATIYPPGGLIFNALNSTPFEKVKVVILGQGVYGRQSPERLAHRAAAPSERSGAESPFIGRATTMTRLLPGQSGILA